MNKLFRTVSIAEYKDYIQEKIFRLGRNTLEAKQFFKTEAGVMKFIKDAASQNFQPPYTKLFIIRLDPECFINLIFDEQELDQFEAITIQEEHLNDFNNCIRFVEYYDV